MPFKILAGFYCEKCFIHGNLYGLKFNTSDFVEPIIEQWQPQF